MRCALTRYCAAMLCSVALVNSPALKAETISYIISFTAIGPVQASGTYQVVFDPTVSFNRHERTDGLTVLAFQEPFPAPTQLAYYSYDNFEVTTTSTFLRLVERAVGVSTVSHS